MALDAATLERLRVKFRELAGRPAYHPAVGDKVRTKYIYFGRHRHGKIVSIDGYYISVKLNYKDIMIEVYPGEIEKL